MKETIQQLDLLLSTVRSEFYQYLKDPLDDKQVEALEEQYQLKLPEDIRVLYGIAGSDRQVSSYVSASSVSDWSQVVSVRVYLLLVSAETNVVAENQTVNFNGVAVTVPNRRLAQVFSATIGIRNRLP